jgi:hypothetical protein
MLYGMLGAMLMVPVIVGRAVAYTTKQLIKAARLWLKRHGVEEWATVTILNGQGPPHPAYLEPGDLWRWSPTSQAWVGPAYNVTWTGGNQIPSFSSPIEGEHVQLYVGAWTVEGRPALADLDRAGTVSAYGLMASDGPDDPSAPGGFASPSAGGSGVAFLAQGAPVHGSAVNLVPNPSAEVNTTGWAGINSAAVAVSTDWAQSGAQSFKLTPNTGFGDPTSGLVASAVNLYVGTATATTAVHTLSVYLTTSAVDIEARLLLQYTSGGTPVNAPVSSYVTLGPTPTRLTVAGAPTSSADRADLNIQIRVIGLARNLTSADLVYADAVMLTRTDGAVGYFDGSTTPDTTYAYAWSGTAHNSPSTRTPLSAQGGPPESPDSPELEVLQKLGPNVTVGDTFTYPPDEVDGLGDDGDYYLDTTGKALYGPKDGVWPAVPAVQGFKLTQLIR